MNLLPFQLLARYASTGGPVLTTSMYTWGNNASGLLGKGNNTQYVYSWKQAAVGGAHTIAIRSDNLLFGWGLNTSGQLGDGTSFSKSSPIQIGTSSWSQVFAGSSFSMAVAPNGSLYVWGNNRAGQLGDGTTINKSIPTILTTSSYTQISAGDAHVLAVAANNSLWAWGYNSNGQLGDSTSVHRSSPVQLGVPNGYYSTFFPGPLPALLTGPSSSILGPKNNSAFELIAGTPYTIEFWAFVNVSNPSQDNFIFQYAYQDPQVSGAINYGWAIAMNQQLRTVTMYYWSTGGAQASSVTSNYAFNLNEWVHFAFSSPDSFNVNTFINGTLVKSNAFAAVPVYSTKTQLVIGKWLAIPSPRYFNGYISNLRFVKGTNVYQYNFTPSTSPLTAITNTVLLTCNDYTFTDDSVNNFTLTPDGTPLINSNTYNTWQQFIPNISPRSPFTNNLVYSWSQVSAGKMHSAAIDSNKKLFTWGSNQYGQLGDATLISRSSPVQVSGSWNNVAVGDQHTLAINNAGSLFTWGSNQYGQLGDNSPAISPATVFTKISSGLNHTMMLRNDGILFGYGLNDKGQLGLGDTVTRSSPVQIGTSSWSSVSAGYDYTTAIRSDGKIFAWGNNDAAQLGDNTMEYGRLSTIFSTGFGFNNAVLAQYNDGTLWAWGAYYSNIFGSVDGNSRSSPVQLGHMYTGLLEPYNKSLSPPTVTWSKISVGYSHVIAKDSSNYLWSWGSGNVMHPLPTTAAIYDWDNIYSDFYAGGNITAFFKSNGVMYMQGVNSNGLLGDGTTVNKIYSPVLIGSFTSVSSFNHTLAIKTDGTLWAWGYNNTGQLGTNDTLNRSSPVQIFSGTTWSTAVVSVNTESMAIKTDGTLWVWGQTGNYFLGGDISSALFNRSSPVQVGTKSNWTSVYAGNNHWAAKDATNQIYVWGQNNRGQLGLGDTITRSSPTQIDSKYVDYVINPSGQFAFYKTNTGEYWGTGSNDFGVFVGLEDRFDRSSPVQIGASYVSRSSPIQVASTNFASWSSISAGFNHNLAITTNNELFGWGSNVDNKVGSNVGVLGTSWINVSIGPNHILAVDSRNKLWTWGLNNAGQLGTNDVNAKSSPVVVRADLNWSKVAAGDSHSLAIASDGTLWGWGLNNVGQIAQAGLSWSNLVLGVTAVLALTSDGSLFAWGYGSSGQLGTGDNINRSNPVQITTITNPYPPKFKTISAFGSVYGALTTDNRVYLWGGIYLSTLLPGFYGVMHLAGNTATPIPTATDSTFTYTDLKLQNYGLKLLRSNNFLYVNGKNDYGQLGLGDTVDRYAITQAFATQNNGYISRMGSSTGLRSIYTTGTISHFDVNPFTITFWCLMGGGDATSTGNQYLGWPSICGNNATNGNLAGDWRIHWGQNGYTGAFAFTAVNQYSGNIGAGGSTIAVDLVSSGLDRSTWNHFAITRNGSTYRIFCNGRLVASTTYGSTVSLGTTAQKIYVGSVLDGYVYDLRIVSSDLYTGLTQISVPTGPSTAVAGTTLLICRNAAGTDEGPGAVAMTVDQAYACTQNPFSNTAGANSGTSKNVAYIPTIGGGNYYSHTGMFIDTAGKLWVTGRNDTGQLGIGDTINRSSPVQVGTSNWSMVSMCATDGYTTKTVYGITTDGKLFGWGQNTYHHLAQGNSDVADRSSPVQIAAGTSFVHVTAKQAWVFAKSSTGTLYGWGQNYFSGLGFSPTQTYAVSYTQVAGQFLFRDDGRILARGLNSSGEYGIPLLGTTSLSSPVLVSSTSWYKISSVNGFVAGIKTDGTLWSWGANANGQLGDSTTINRSSPVQVAGSWTSVAANGDTSKFVVAIKTNGTMWGWGYNGQGQLVTNDTVDRSSPVQIGVDTNWTSVSAGSQSIAGIKSDSRLFTWGQNDRGQVGDGTTITRSSPVQVAGSWSLVSIGASSVSAIKIDNTLWGWGFNSVGQLGTTDIINRSSPVQIGSQTNWTYVIQSNNVSYAMAINTNGSLFGWGLNTSGQLGVSDNINRSSPVQVGTSSWSVVSAFGNATTAIDTNNLLYVWGSSDNAIFGIYPLGAGTQRSSPVQVGNNATLYSTPQLLSDTAYDTFFDAGGDFYTSTVNFATGSNKTKLYVWSATNSQVNTQHIQGAGDTILRSSPVQTGVSAFSGVLSNRSNPVQIHSSSYTQITAGISFSAAIKTDGTLNVFGSNVNGRLGDGTTLNRILPTQIGASSWTMISANTDYMMGISGTNLYTWGNNNVGQLGINNTLNRSSPVQVSGSFAVVAAGGSTSYAIDSQGLLFGWGLNNAGQLGISATINRSSPVQIGTSSWVTVSAGTSHVAAEKLDSTIWTWGLNSVGQLGLGDIINRSSPVQFGTVPYPSVVAGGLNTVVTMPGTGLIFGDGGSGKMGNFTSTSSSSPVILAGTNISMYNNITYPSRILTNSYIMASAGYYHSVAIRNDNSLWAWGRNNYGQLGVSDNTTRNSPTQVGISSWTQVQAGMHTTGGILSSNNSLYTWGDNTFMNLGNVFLSTPTTSQNSPVFVDVYTSFTMGLYHTMAIKPDGTLWSWGSNAWGQLGTNNETWQSSPTQIGTSKHVAISIMSSTSVAVDDAGNVKAWGSNMNGAIPGYPNLGSYSWTSISTPSQRTYMIRSDGLVKYIGNLSILSASDNNVTPWGARAMPDTLPGSWLQLASSYYSPNWGWGIDNNNNLYSIGSGTSGELGDGTTQARSSAVQIGTSYVSVNSFFNAIYGIKTDGSLWVWGTNSIGELGLGNTTTPQYSPVKVGASSWSQVVSGGWNNSANWAMGITADGKLFSWGKNNSGQLGLGDTLDRTSPVQVNSPNSYTVLTTTLFSQSLGIRKDGTLWAWGSNYVGGMGDNSSVGRSSPVQVAGSWTWVGSIQSTIYGLKTDGTLWFWGGPDQGANGWGISRSSPTQLASGVSKVYQPKRSWLWFTKTGDSRIWAQSNYNSSSDAGLPYANNSITTQAPTYIDNAKSISSPVVIVSGASSPINLYRSSPAQVGSNSWTSIEAGDNHSLGTSSGTLFAWGINTLGQVGDNTTINRSSPVQVSGTYDSVQAGDNFNVAMITSNSSLVAFGANDVGQLGDLT